MRNYLLVNIFSVKHRYKTRVHERDFSGFYATTDQSTVPENVLRVVRIGTAYSYRSEIFPENTPANDISLVESMQRLTEAQLAQSNQRIIDFLDRLEREQNILTLFDHNPFRRNYLA